MSFCYDIIYQLIFQILFVYYPFIHHLLSKLIFLFFPNIYIHLVNNNLQSILPGGGKQNAKNSVEERVSCWNNNAICWNIFFTDFNEN
jgi:hypothetical protein